MNKRLLFTLLSLSGSFGTIHGDILAGRGSSFAQFSLVDGLAVGAISTGSSPRFGTVLNGGTAFGFSFNGGINLGAVDLNGDGYGDLLLAMRRDGQTVQVVDGKKFKDSASPISDPINPLDPANLIHDFEAFGPTLFSGGVSVAGGDVNGDGQADIVVGAASNGGTIRALDGLTLQELYSERPFGLAYRSGVQVAVGELSADNPGEEILAAGLGDDSVGLVLVLSLDGGILDSIVPIDGFQGALSVAAGDFNGDGVDDILAGANEPDLESRVVVIDGATGEKITEFLTGIGDTNGGVHLSTGDLNYDGVDDVIITEAAGRAWIQLIDGVMIDQITESGELDQSAIMDAFYVYSNTDGGSAIHVPNPAQVVIGAPFDFSFTYRSMPGSFVQYRMSFDKSPNHYLYPQFSPDLKRWLSTYSFRPDLSGGDAFVTFPRIDEGKMFYRLVSRDINEPTQDDGN